MILHPESFIIDRVWARGKSRRTYSKNGGIIGNLGGRWLVFFGRFFNAQVLYIGSAKDNVLIDAIGASNLVFGVVATTLRTERLDIFESNGRGFGVDFVEGANVSVQQVSKGNECATVAKELYLMSLLDMSEIRDLTETINTSSRPPRLQVPRTQ